MPIFDRAYHPYRGPLRPPRNLPWVLYRRGMAEALGSRMVALLLFAAGIETLVFALLIYLHYNLAAIRVLHLEIAQLVPLDASFFALFLLIAAVLAFFLALWIGPGVIARDKANNALPLFLSRPLTRPQYLWGKMLPLLVLLSLVTWVAGLFLFFLQSALAAPVGGQSWFRANAYIGWAIFLGGLVWVVLLALVANALSAGLKRRWPAAAALAGLFFIPGIAGQVVDQFLVHPWGQLISALDLMRIIWGGLFRLPMVRHGFVPAPGGGRVWGVLPVLPAWSAWLTVAIIAAACLALLARSLRPYPPVR